MNVNDLLKKMHNDQMNDKKVIYLISGYYRNFNAFSFYKSYSSLYEHDLTNEEIIDVTQKFLSTVNTWYEDNKTPISLPVQFSNNPYVFSFYNNCIEAGRLGVTTMLYVTSTVKCYHVHKNGSVYWQMDDETGLISAKYVDALSDRLGEDFSKLMDIKLEQTEKELK